MDEKLFAKVEKVFGDECEKYVVGVVLYAEADEGTVSLDVAGKETLTKDEAFALLVRGAIIKCGTAFYKPVMFAETSGYLTITTAGDATAKVFYTNEKTA